MALIIRAIDGPAKRQNYTLKAGFIIGRTKGDLIVPEDNKVSGKHAFVEQEDGALYLVDNKSKNGLKLNGFPATRIKLIPGIQIIVGSYTYEIIEIIETPPEQQKPRARYWYDILGSFLKKLLPSVQSRPKPIEPLHPAIVLAFVRGGQVETKWVLGYGPRQIGAKSLDLPIFEANAPDVCFEIIPTAEGISFRTEHPKVVQLNGQAIEQKILHIADVIYINNTQIEVDFI
jgi:FHA domain